MSEATFYLEYHDNAQIDGDLLKVTAVARSYNEKMILRYKIQSQAEKERLKDTNFYGRICKVSGQLEQPLIAKNPNAFDYQKYLQTKKIYYVLVASEYPLRECHSIPSSPFVLIKELRFNGIKLLENHFPPEVASLSAALIFGDRSLFDPELIADYQESGIVHLLAISGLHVSLLIGMIYYMGLRFGLTREFMTNFLLVLLPIYAILVGASASVIRAVLMIFLVLFTLKWKRQLKLSPIDSISLAFMIYILLTPKIIYDPGFQLSFAVSFAIILSASAILLRYQHTVSQMLVISIVSQLAALPILLYHFFEISFISLAANLVYIPLFSFVFLPGLYLLFFFQLIFGQTPAIFIDIFMKIILFANDLIHLFSGITFFKYIPGRPHDLFLIVYVVMIVMVFLYWEVKINRKKLLVLTFILFSFQPIWNWVNPFGEIIMIDVGQGDSILIDLPFRKGTYLIDTGGTMSFEKEEWRKRAKPFEVGRDVVVPFLKGKGITKIDKLILTHGDTDHMGGVDAVIQELKVKQILLPFVAEPSAAEINLMQKAKKKGIPVVKVSEGNQWITGNSLFYVLAPEKKYEGERNSGSIAIFANVGGLKWFFGGDLDQPGEEKIAGKYPNIKVDVLKAGHHGSKTSTSELFVKKLKPRVAWISAGEKNRYGHPHQEVLERLEHTKIYRTDQQGAIIYRFFNNNGTFSTYLP